MNRFRSPPLLSQAWLLLGVASLGLGALAAFALVVARTPGVSAYVPADAFARTLVVHVNLATLIWYLAVACGLWTERLPASRARLGAAAFALSLVGALGVVACGLIANGAPVLANYVPFLDDLLFLAALGCFALGGLATALLSLKPPSDAAEWGFAIARWPFVMAACYLMLRLGGGASLIEALWGVGHVLQFGHVTLLMAIWLRLTERAGSAALPTPIALVLFGAAALPATAAPLLVLSGMLGDEALHRFHTEWMRWTNWPAPLAFGGLLILRDVRAAWRAEAFAVSLGLFVMGCLAGLAIGAQTTMIPAHYHGTIGAFTLALMAAVIARLALEGGGGTRLAVRPVRLPLTLYSLGITVLIAGLAWSGALGAPRKSPFSADEAELGPMLAASLTGLGGAITVAGVCLFVFIATSRLVRLCIHRPLTTPPLNHRADAPTFAAAP